MQVRSQKNLNPALDIVFFNTDGLHRNHLSFTFLFPALSIPFAQDPLSCLILILALALEELHTWLFWLSIILLSSILP